MIGVSWFIRGQYYQNENVELTAKATAVIKKATRDKKEAAIPRTVWLLKETRKATKVNPAAIGFRMRASTCCSRSVDDPD